MTSFAGNRQIQEIPGALRSALDKARSEFAAVVRKVRWGDGPVYVCGAGESAALGQAAGYAFESFVGSPVVARPVEVFQTYALSLLQPRSVLLIISAAGEWPEAQELAHTARQRGCTVVALTNTPDSSLAKLADHAFLMPAAGDADSPAVAVGLHAAINLLALATARTLKRPERHWDAVSEEFERLPEKIEWAFTQLAGAVRSTAAELARGARLSIVGGGFYHYPAWRAARRLRTVPSLSAEAIEASEFSAHGHLASQDDAVLLLSGSHSKIKKLLHQCATQARMNGARVLSLTDSNDRDLVASSDLATLVPSLLEAPSSTLTLSVLEWLALEVVRAQPVLAAKTPV